MRLISQNGTYDIPYELSSVFIFRSRNSYEIRTFTNGTAVPVFMAEYSTEEKAKGVMEMIKEKYLSVCYNGLQVPIIDYFHFHADDEVEV